MTKNELRKIYLEKRKQLSEKDKMIADDLMLLQFQNLNFNNLHYVLSYWPLLQHNEPNTQLFTRYLKYFYPELQIAYPVTDTKSNTMQARLTNDDTTFSINQWGIAEPTEGDWLLPTMIDLVLVPLLIFDLKGYRVGYGKGFYDKFLIQCNKNIITIGFSYFEPVAKISDTQPFDVPLTYCITPNKRYEF